MTSRDTKTAPVTRGGRGSTSSNQRRETTTANATAQADSRIGFKKILLSEISANAATQVRVKIDPEIVEQYAEAMQDGVTFPSIVLFYDGARYHLGDGFHRVEAARQLDFRDIAATVEQGTASDALWFAIGANQAHGLRMTRADVRKAISLALQQFPDRSNREIARQIGCSHNTVADEREAMESTGQIDQLKKTVGADGKARPTTYTARGGVDKYTAEDRPPDPLSGKIILPKVDADEDAKSESANLAGLKRYWRLANKKEREAFMSWATDRGSDLPKGGYRSLIQATHKIIRLVRANPKLRNEVRIQLFGAGVLEGGAK